MTWQLRASTLASQPQDIPKVRHGLTTELRSLGASSRCIEEAAVMVSELVSNVLMHTESPAEVLVSAGRGLVRVAVADDSRAVPVPQPVDPTRVGGNGLRIVEAMATEWGVTLVPGDGKVVWFTVPVD